MSSVAVVERNLSGQVHPDCEVVPRDGRSEASLHSILDISENGAFEVFLQWSSFRREDMICDCQSGPECMWTGPSTFFFLKFFLR